MERWTALLPDKHVAGPAHPRIPLIGRLPEEAYIAILQFLPVPDLPAFALCSRKLAALTKDDRVWRAKLALLNYRGPGEIAWRDGDRRGGEAVHESTMRDGELVVPQGASLPVPSPLFVSPEVDDEFGDFFEGEGDVSLVHDDGFGDFQDFGGGQALRPGLVSDPFGIGEDLSKVSLGSPAALAKPRTGGGDLMMMFDDDDFAPPPTLHRPPNDSHLTFQTPNPSIRTPSLATSQSNSTTPTSPPRTRPASDLSLRDIFIKHHSLLLPYYLSLLTHTTSSLVFTSPTLTPATRSQLLSSLVRFCAAAVAPTRSLPQRTTVLRNAQSAADFFESALLAEFERADERRDEASMREKAAVLWDLNGSSSVAQIFVQKREIFYDQSHNPLKNLVKIETPMGDKADGIDFSAMDAYMKHVLRVVEREGGLIARIFPFEADVLVYFTERIANDVISDYITSLLSAAQALQHPLFLLATAATFGQVYRLVDAVLEIEPKSPMVTKERVEDVVFKMFEPLMDDYLQEEADWIREVLEGVCAEWDEKTASDLAISDPTFLASSNPAQVKRNVLAGFTKVLLLPVTIIPKTASYGLNAITVGATGAFNTFASLGGGLGAQFGSGVSRTQTPVPAIDEPKIIDASWGDAIPRASIDDASGIVSFPTSLTSPSPSTEPSKPSQGRFDQLQLLLSLDTALQLIQADRDCLKRVQTFVRYPGTYGRKVRDAIEEVFIILLQTLGEKHVCPAFAKATAQMGAYRPEEHEQETSVAPLVQFFELVHIGDTIQQMVEVYFDKEMAAFIDKKDFLNTVVREKKRFEMSLDDAVAQGLNAGVNILMRQVEHIITTHQDPADYCPAEGADMDLRPTRACREAIETLETHCNMLKGSTDKQILEVFHQEVGIRLHGIILKHLKRLIVSIEGGFQLIADLNAYHAFVSSLRQPNITSYFTSLKMVGEIYVIDSPKDLGQLVRDVSRYEGTLSADDLYECVQRRADWKRIDKQVEKQLFGLKLQEDCTIC